MMRKHTKSVTKFKDIEIMMKEIEPPVKYFFMDANIIKLVNEIKEFNDWNPTAFEQMIRNIDSFLKLTYEMELGLINCSNSVDVLRDLMIRAMNHFQSIIHKTPHQRMLQSKFITALKRMHIYLQRHMDKSIDLCNEYSKNSGHQALLYKDHPIGLDSSNNPHYNLF